MMKWTRNVARAGVLLGAVVVLDGCSGETRPASNIGRTTATLNAHGSCDGVPGKPCYFYFRLSRDNQSWTGGIHGPVTGSANGPVSENWRNLQPRTTYTYQFCGKGDDNVPNWTCVNSVGFTTLP